jgi:hypothetical protein
VKPKSAVTAFAILALLGIFRGWTLLAKDQPTTNQSRPSSRFRDRHEFVKSLSSIKEGMTPNEVIGILGKPDDIRKPDEMHPWVGEKEPKEIWCFGTDGHRTFPTLGIIWFTSARGGQIVDAITGANGTPPPPALFDEGELRRLLSMLNEENLFSVNIDWSPAWTIKVVNTLAPLGKLKALAAIQEYVRVWPYSSDYELGKLLRVLFDVPKETGYMRRFPYFPTDLPRPEDLKRIPRFPMMILGDVPLQIVGFKAGFRSGRTMTSMDYDFAKEVAWFRDHASIRTKLLQPTSKPLQLFSEWKAYGWLYRDIKASDSFWLEYVHIEYRVKWQLRDLVMTVYRGDIEHGTLPRPVHWDMKRNMYTFLDGTSLPDDSAKKGRNSQRTR